MIALRWLAPTLQDEGALTALLGEEERTRAQRFHHGADRLAYAAAHALLRTLLSEIGGGAPGDWRFVRTPAGKPHLDRTPAQPDLRFSLSHARGMAACGVASGRDLGVDVEPLAPVADAAVLARTHFSAREADRLAALPPDLRSAAFVRLWTLKEAYVKATGQGLAGCPNAPEFDLDEIAGASVVSCDVGGQAWRFQHFDLPGPFAFALAVQVVGAETRVTCIETQVRPDGLHPSA